MKTQSQLKSKVKTKKPSQLKSASDFYQGLSEKRRNKIETGAQILIMEYELLKSLRKTRQLTQKETADIMEIGQSAISKIEHQDDILIRTLERYVAALGGELEIRVNFPDATYSIGNFSQPRFVAVTS